MGFIVSLWVRKASLGTDNMDLKEFIKWLSVHWFAIGGKGLRLHGEDVSVDQGEDGGNGKLPAVAQRIHHTLRELAAKP